MAFRAAVVLLLMSSKYLSINISFIFGNRKKVIGARSGELAGCFNTVVVVAVVVVILAVVLIVVVLLVGVVVIVGYGSGGDDSNRRLWWLNAAFQNATYRFTNVQLSNYTYPVYLRF
jgi:hypothetical protein